MALEKGSVAKFSLCFIAFTPGKVLRYSFYRKLSEPQDQSEHEGVKRNLHPFYTRDRTRVVQPVTKRLDDRLLKFNYFLKISLYYLYCHMTGHETKVDNGVV